MFEVNELLKATAGKLIQGRQDIMLKGVSIDSRQISPGEAFIAIRGPNFDGHDFISEAIKKGAAALIVHSSQFTVHGESEKKIAVIEVRDTTQALGDIARFQREKFDIPVIAVTGSNGKTTTKEMIAWVFSKNYKVLKNEGTKNNHIGLPLTLLKLDSSYKIAVLEIGTNHFGEIGYLAGVSRPNIGVIINIGPAHLEYLHNLEGVFKEKYSLIKELQKPYISILNADDNLLRKEIAKNTKKPFIVGCGIKNKSDFFASDIKRGFGKLEFLANRKFKFTLQTPGYYNVYNALIAIALARIFGMAYKDIASRFSTFDFPQGRLKIRELNNIKFIDDTYNSNPDSLRQALDALGKLQVKGRKIFVMGDMLELGREKELFHCQAGQSAAKICAVFITVGELSKLAAKAAAAKLGTRNIYTCATSGDAREVLFDKIAPKKDDVILVKGSRMMKMEEVFKT